MVNVDRERSFLPLLNTEYGRPFCAISQNVWRDLLAVTAASHAMSKVPRPDSAPPFCLNIGLQQERCAANAVEPWQL